MLETWHRHVLCQGNAVEVRGRKVVLGDHTAVVKDGGRMPGVVSLRETSETQSKPSYFRGHSWGTIGLLTGTLTACFCCPLQLQLHQGWAHRRKKEAAASPVRVRLAERLVAMAIRWAVTQQCRCYLVLDAFFSVSSVFRACRYYSLQDRTPWVEVLVKAKANYVGYCPAPPKPAGRRGRPARYGEKICLRECFDHPHLFQTVTCSVYGRLETIRVLSLELLWRPLADRVLFIGAITSRGPLVLMSSDLTLPAAQAVELYCARTRIEILFAVLKHLIGAFQFHFWTHALPKHSRQPVANRQLKAPSERGLNSVLACWRAYETFVLCASIAVGLLQQIALTQSDTVWAHQQLYLRTKSRDLPSEKTVRQILQPLLLDHFFRLDSPGLMAPIRRYLNALEADLDRGG